MALKEGVDDGEQFLALAPGASRFAESVARDAMAASFSGGLDRLRANELVDGSAERICECGEDVPRRIGAARTPILSLLFSSPSEHKSAAQAKPSLPPPFARRPASSPAEHEQGGGKRGEAARVGANPQAYGALEADYRPTRWNTFRAEHKFTGKEEDIEVGLTYFGARYYQAHLGRWASADPLTIHGLGADLNPYAYVHGRTMSLRDPFGLDPFSACDGPASPCPEGSNPVGGGGSSEGSAGGIPTIPNEVKAGGIILGAIGLAVVGALSVLNSDDEPAQQEPVRFNRREPELKASKPGTNLNSGHAVSSAGGSPYQTGASAVTPLQWNEDTFLAVAPLAMVPLTSPAAMGIRAVGPIAAAAAEAGGGGIVAEPPIGGGGGGGGGTPFSGTAYEIKHIAKHVEGTAAAENSSRRGMQLTSFPISRRSPTLRTRSSLGAITPAQSLAVRLRRSDSAFGLAARSELVSRPMEAGFLSSTVRPP